MNAESIVALVALVVSLPLSGWALWQAKVANDRASRSNQIASEANQLATEANTSARRSADASERAAITAEEQTTIQNAIRRSSAEPLLYVDLRPDQRSGRILRLVVGNSGPTVATNVQVTFDPPLAKTIMQLDSIHLGEEALRDGLASLPPGREVVWAGGAVGDIFIQNADSPLSWVVTINANGPLGSLEPVTYTLDLKGLAQSTTAPTGTLFGVTQELKEVQKQLKALTGVARDGYRMATAWDREPDSPED